jgi:hypothetical protein
MDLHSKINKTIETTLSRAFFSSENVLNIQNDIVSRVQIETKINISYQDEAQLLTLMRNVMNTDGEFHMSSSDEDIFQRSLQERIYFMNHKVVRSATDNIKKGIITYTKYIKDASSLPVPIPRAQLTSRDNSMEMNKRFF